MKSFKNTIEIQEACLLAAKVVFNAMEQFATRVEKENLLIEEPEITLEPYNQGYIIKSKLYWDYRNKKSDEYAEYRTHLYIQPCSFFDQYLDEGYAYLEYSLFSKSEKGYFSGRTEQTGDLNKLKTEAARWGRTMSTEINYS